MFEQTEEVWEMVFYWPHWEMVVEIKLNWETVVEINVVNLIQPA